MQAQCQKSSRASPSPHPHGEAQHRKAVLGLLHTSHLNTKQITLNDLTFHKTTEMGKNGRSVDRDGGKRGKERRNLPNENKQGKMRPQGVDGSPGSGRRCHCYLTPDPRWGPLPRQISRRVSIRTGQHNGPKS